MGEKTRLGPRNEIPSTTSIPSVCPVTSTRTGPTDFPSIIEGLSKAAAGQSKAPIPITVPHENLAVSMAHGAYLATGRAQAVMLHVNVGTANAVCALLNAALDGSLNNAEFRVDPNFGFDVPVSVDGVDDAILDPRSTWSDKDEYDRTAHRLVRLFVDNFAEFEAHVDEGVRQAAPQQAA